MLLRKYKEINNNKRTMDCGEKKGTILSRVTKKASLKRWRLSNYLKKFRQVVQLCGWKTFQEPEATNPKTWDRIIPSMFSDQWGSWGWVSRGRIGDLHWGRALKDVIKTWSFTLRIKAIGGFWTGDKIWPVF